MDVAFFGRLRENLQQKRRAVTSWLDTTPEPQRRSRLGLMSEQDVLAHLQVVDTALEQVEEETLGICTVCHEAVDAELLEMDYTSCICLAHYSTEEIRQLEAELELAQVVQRSLLPQSAPHIPGLEIAAYSRPSQILGGDTFDFVQFRDGRYGLALADVAGHGMSASLLMASVQTALRTLIPVSDSPADVLGQVNRLFSHNVNFTTFVTLFLAAYDAGSSRLTYSNAGHNPPLVVHDHHGGDQALSWLKPTGAAVGLVEDFRIDERAIPLATGDVLVLYTDGVTEAFNSQGEEFGVQRLARLVQQSAALPVQDLVRTVREGLVQFTAQQALADDTTIVAATRI